jgi:hypothetical protein
MRRALSLACIVLAVAAIGAIASPHESRSSSKLPPFKRLLYDRIGRSWYAKVEAHKDDLTFGTVNVAVTLSADGKILKLRILSNTSNEVLAKISADAIREAKIPSIPPAFLSHGKFELTIPFTIYPD